LLIYIIFYNNRLDKLYTEKTKGRQIRSRVKWIEEGEKNTAFFLGLEKTRQTKKVINELYDKNDKSTIKPSSPGALFSFILKIACVHSSIVISPSHFSLSLLLSLL
jgi:hypothetical protein